MIIQIDYMSMDKNVGVFDRRARIVIGAVLLVVAVLGYVGMIRLAFGPLPQALTAVVLLLVGIILLGTGLTQRCLIYRVVGMTTRNR